MERRAFRIANFATANPDDALDIVQDAMTKLVEKYANKSAEDWPPLFYRILENRIGDWRRRRVVRDKVIAWLKPKSRDVDEAPIDLIAEAVAPSHYQPEEGLEAERTVDRLGQALHVLPRRQQQVFLLRVWEGLDVRQTAVAMGCSQGSVKTHYSRALASLRSQLGDIR